MRKKESYHLAFMILDNVIKFGISDFKDKGFKR
jgi:hypothetical protein